MSDLYVYAPAESVGNSRVNNKKSQVARVKEKVLIKLNSILWYNVCIVI